MPTPLVTFSVARYRPASAVWGALRTGTLRAPLRRVPGLRFAKLLGTGSGIGFSAVPDPLRWALFACWEARRDWERFRDESPVMLRFRKRAAAVDTLLMLPASAHGRWEGSGPLGAPPDSVPLADDAPVAILTRATIRVSRALRFWSLVPAVDATLRGRDGLLLSVGFGEIPWLRQGTLSVWSSATVMREWAYGSTDHLAAMRRTRAEGWYAEELFARLRVVGRESR
ncbi:hypothetical protein BH20GEM2_BH20GEM2_19230 [soil metagenome]